LKRNKYNATKLLVVKLLKTFVKKKNIGIADLVVKKIANYLN